MRLIRATKTKVAQRCRRELLCVYMQNEDAIASVELKSRLPA